jgi:hypothetical protein
MMENYQGYQIKKRIISRHSGETSCVKIVLRATACCLLA